LLLRRARNANRLVQRDIHMASGSPDTLAIHPDIITWLPS
jgi:hypothetical protein